MSGYDILCKLDRLIEDRAPLSFLLGLRRQLIGWGFNTKEVKVNDEELSLSVARVPVLHAKVIDMELKLQWDSDAWEKWALLQESAELQQLIKVASDKLANSAGSITKGKGKGPGKGS